jgi:hypothetical protein
MRAIGRWIKRRTNKSMMNVSRTTTAGANQSVTVRPFVRSWETDPIEAVTTAAPTVCPSWTAGTATIVEIGEGSTLIVSWRVAAATAVPIASSRSTDAVLATVRRSRIRGAFAPERRYRSDRGGARSRRRRQAR